MNKIKKLSLFFCSGLLFFFFGLGENGFSLPAKGKTALATARLIQFEDQALPDKLRVLIKTSQPVSHHSFTMSGPYRLVIDLSPCILVKDSSFEIKDPSVERWRFSQFNKKTVRIVLEFTRLPVYHISFQKEKTYSLFVDFPRIKPPMAQGVLKPAEQGYLPEMNIEDFKKEKQVQDSRQKKKILLSQKPLVTFDFYMTNLHNVLRLIGDTGGVNIVVGDDVKEKKITLSLKEVPWDEALDSILDSNNLKRIKRGEKTFLVTTSENYKKIQDDENKRQVEAIKREQEELKNEELRQKVGKVLWSTRQFQIKYVDVKVVEDLIQGSLEKEKKIASDKQPGSERVTLTETTKILGSHVNIISVPHTNVLIAKGAERDLNYIEDLIKTIDQPIPQVMIEARIVEADANFTRDLGIRWGGAYAFANSSAPYAGTIRGGDAGQPGSNSNYAVNLPFTGTSAAFGGLGFAFASTNLNIDARIQAMEQDGRGKTISSPKVLTVDNKEAIIKQGQSIPVTTRDQNNSFSTTYKDAALKLTVTPHISSSKKIRIKVKIDKNEPDFSHADTLGNPTINIKETETEMMVNDGDTVIIGGILSKKETYSENRVPGLADIPVLGWLFKTRSKSTTDTELLIFITPKILKPSLSERFGGES